MKGDVSIVAISTAVASSQGAQPQTGFPIGSAIPGIGKVLGYS